MKFKSTKIIQELENQINNSYSLPIFRGYVAINKRGVEKLISEIYHSLPEDTKTAHEYLKKQKPENNLTSNKNSQIEEKNLYNYLKKFEIKINEALNVASYIIINIQEMEELLNNIQTNIPDEIIEAQTLSKE